MDEYPRPVRESTASSFAERLGLPKPVLSAALRCPASIVWVDDSPATPCLLQRDHAGNHRYEGTAPDQPSENPPRMHTFFSQISDEISHWHEGSVALNATQLAGPISDLLDLAREGEAVRARVLALAELYADVPHDHEPGDGHLTCAACWVESIRALVFCGMRKPGGTTTCIEPPGHAGPDGRDDSHGDGSFVRWIYSHADGAGQ